MDILCIMMVSRMYQSLVAVTSISRSQGVIMYEILLCVHDNSINICPRLSMLGYNVYHDDILILVVVTSISRLQEVIMCEK